MSNGSMHYTWACCKPSLQAFKKAIEKENPPSIGPTPIQQFLQSAYEDKVFPVGAERPEWTPDWCWQFKGQSQPQGRRNQHIREPKIIQADATGFLDPGLPDWRLPSWVIAIQSERRARERSTLNYFSHDDDDDSWYELGDQVWGYLKGKGKYKPGKVFDHKCPSCGKTVQYTIHYRDPAVASSKFFGEPLSLRMQNSTPSGFGGILGGLDYP